MQRYAWALDDRECNEMITTGDRRKPDERYQNDKDPSWRQGFTEYIAENGCIIGIEWTQAPGAWHRFILHKTVTHPLQEESSKHPECPSTGS